LETASTFRFVILIEKNIVDWHQFAIMEICLEKLEIVKYPKTKFGKHFSSPVFLNCLRYIADSP